MDCYNKQSRRQYASNKYQNIKLEHSDAWRKGDKEANKFFVYILKDSKGKFYVGHTRDLRARLSEHRDNKTKSTAGRNMKLEYFEEVANRRSAEEREVELKEILYANERKIRKMIMDFRDRIREVKVD